MHSLQEDPADPQLRRNPPDRLQDNTETHDPREPAAVWHAGPDGTAERDQAIAPGCTVETASQKGLISQIGPQHHPAGAVTDQRDAPCRRLALKFTHSGINAIKQATPTETPAGGQPIQFGRRHDVHRSACGLINPISEGAIGLLRDQKATEDNNGLIQRNRSGI